MRIDRRLFLAGAAGAFSAGRAFAAETPEAIAARLLRTGVVINGNLMAPVDDAAPLPAADAAMVRDSGLSAFKMTLGGASGTFAETEEEISAFDKAMTACADTYRKVVSVTDIEAARATGKVGLIYSFEAAEMLEGRIDRIDHFARRGVKVMQLSYNTPTPFASGVMSPQPSSGLTELGAEAVARMNAVGVTLDLSHADERSTLAAVAVARKPPLITHAGCAAVYVHPRNKSDAALKAVADKGGVVGIYELSYLSAGPEQTTLGQYMAHLLHALKVCGEDHVGIGSDALIGPFDTSPESMKQWNDSIAARKAAGVSAPGEGRPPYVEGLNRSDRMRVVATELLKRGVRERAVAKIIGGNFLRVFGETWTA